MIVSGWFKGLRGKLLISAILPIIAFVALTTLSIRSMNSLGDMLTTAYTDIIPNLDGLGRIGMQRARVGYFVWAALAIKEDPKARTNFINKAQDAFDDFKKGQDFYESTSFDEEEAKNYASAKEAKSEFLKLTQSMIDGLRKDTPEDDAYVFKAMNGGDWHVLALKTQSSIAANMKLYNERSIEANKAQQDSRKAQTQLLLLIAGFCAFSLFAIMMTLAYKVSNAVTTIASGLSEAGNQVSSAITQLTAAGQTLSESSTETAASLEETVASLEEMSSMVKMNSDNAKQAAALSQSSRDSAEQGQNEIHHLIESMQAISTSSKKIEEIISVIDDIAFQTNLLALNAAVEAARAGEHGKGFAVVAEAVRTLAQRSAVAAKDINVLIKDSVEKVDKGSSIADRSGEVLSNIVNSVKKVSDLNSEISAASTEQTAGIQQISKAMNQLDQGSQANAASSEEVAASAEEINAQALQMKRMVEGLNQVILGSMASAPAPAVHPPPVKKEASKVVAFAPKKVAKTPHAAANVIPFEDDESPRKVGTTSGF